jgi:hypothetical protein
MSRRRAKRKEFYGAAVLGKFYQLGRLYITLSDEMMASDSYRVLTPLQRCILLDVLRTIRNKYREFLPEYARSRSFTYTYSECRVPASENAFHGALRELLRVGWLDVLPEHQRAAIAGPIYYTVSERWKKYTLRAEERIKLSAKTNGKKRRVEQNRERKAELFNEN